MTKVNVIFGKPEPYFDLELDTQSLVAYNEWLWEEDDNKASALWDSFLEEFERQVRPLIGVRGWVEEVYEVGD